MGTSRPHSRLLTGLVSNWFLFHLSALFSVGMLATKCRFWLCPLHLVMLGRSPALHLPTWKAGKEFPGGVSGGSWRPQGGQGEWEWRLPDALGTPAQGRKAASLSTSLGQRSLSSLAPWSAPEIQAPSLGSRLVTRETQGAAYRCRGNPARARPRSPLGAPGWSSHADHGVRSLTKRHLSLEVTLQA